MAFIVTPVFATLMAALIALAFPAGAQTRSDTTVKTLTAPRYRGVATITSEVKIGGAGAVSDEYIFARIDEVFPLRDGSIVVVDQGSGTSPFVRIYDQSGKYMRTLGRFGEGPGEYTIPNGVAQLPDGRILVRDARGGRISIYDSVGKALQWKPAGNLNSTSLAPNFLTATPAGVVFVRVNTRMAPGVPPQTGFLRFRQDGTPIDTILNPVLTVVEPAILIARRGTGSSISHSLPFAPHTFAALSPLGYYVTGTTGRYAIDLRIPPPTPPAAGSSNPFRMWREGDPVTSLRRNVTPVPVGDAERAERRKWIEDGLREVDPAWRWTGPDVPRVKAAFWRVRFGLDGRIWVELTAPSERFDPSKEPPRAAIPMSGGRSGAAGAPTTTSPRQQITFRDPLLFDVLEPDGTYIGQVSIPFGVHIHAFRGDHAWGLTRDSDGVETAHRFRINWR